LTSSIVTPLAASAARDAPDLSKLLSAVLDGAMALTDADFGNVQIFDPATGALEIAAHSGLQR
jgi:hypothetical protein